MAERKALLGIFAYLDDLLAAIEKVKEGQGKVRTVYSPIPSHEIQEALDVKPSPVRFFTLLGGLAGLVTGIGLAAFAGLQWKFITGGKPVLAWVPFTVVGFEFFILFAVFGTLAGMLVNSRLPRMRIVEPYDPRFTQDRFGLLISCSEGEVERVEEILKGSGAEEIRGLDR